MAPTLYEQQVIDEDVKGNLSIATLFKTAQGMFYESRRQMTTRYAVTDGMGSWVRTNQGLLEAGVERQSGRTREYPLVGGQAVLTTLNRMVYFLAPRESVVTFDDLGVGAQVDLGHRLLPYFADEKDTLIVRLNKAQKDREPLRRSLALLAEAVWQLGEHNVPSSIIRYGLLPEMAYLGGVRIQERVDQIECGQFRRQAESERLLAQTNVQTRVREPELVSL